MLNRNWILVGVVLISLPTTALRVRADSYLQPRGPASCLRTWCTPVARPDSNCWCDDYCKKQLPFTPCYTPRTCYDDYCKKGLPCQPQNAPRSCFDDYCKKSCPVRLW